MKLEEVIAGIGLSSNGVVGVNKDVACKRGLIVGQDDEVAIEFGEEIGELTGNRGAEKEGGRGDGGKDDGELKL